LELNNTFRMNNVKLILVTGATGYVGSRLIPYLLEWVTHVSAAYARPLIEGLRNEVVVTDNKASRLFPDIKPAGYEYAVRRAISQLDPEYFEVKFDPTQDTGRLVRFSKIRNVMILEVRQRVVCSDVETVYAAFTELGGANGCPCNLAWRLRVAIDRIIGGVGMRKGRPQPGNIKLDDTVDFLRVVKIEPNRYCANYVLCTKGFVRYCLLVSAVACSSVYF